MDPMEWMMAGLMGVLVLLATGVVIMMAGTGYFAVKCYQSGDPDSMACYMTNGKTSRISADVRLQ